MHLFASSYGANPVFVGDFMTSAAMSIEHPLPIADPVPPIIEDASEGLLAEGLVDPATAGAGQSTMGESG